MTGIPRPEPMVTVPQGGDYERAAAERKVAMNLDRWEPVVYLDNPWSCESCWCTCSRT